MKIKNGEKPNKNNNFLSILSKKDPLITEKKSKEDLLKQIEEFNTDENSSLILHEIFMNNPRPSDRGSALPA